MTNNAMAQIPPHTSTEAAKRPCILNLNSNGLTLRALTPEHGDSTLQVPWWHWTTAQPWDCSCTPGAHTQCSLPRTFQNLRHRQFCLQQLPFYTIPECQPTNRTVLPGMHTSEHL